MSGEQQQPQYLVVFYGVSSGLNGVNLGSDEQDLVTLVYLVINIQENKIVGIHKYAVSPSVSDINENLLSEEVTTEFGIKEADIKGAPPLSSVIRQFDILARDVLGGEDNFTLVTDGQLHLRQCLYPEASRKNIILPAYYQRFHDLRKEFSSYVTSLDDSSAISDSGGQYPQCIEDMLKTLNLPEDDTQEVTLKTVNNMAKVIQKLLSCGNKFHHPETIMTSLEQEIRTRSQQVDGGCVVRARGLPWQASDADIAKFFTGLNVCPGGVALCLSAQGRRNGEALVLFQSVVHRDLALKRHKHHIGNRYIEVYKASGEDFISVAGGNNTEAQEFLSRGGQVIIRMRGLPYDCTAKQVIEFFNNGDQPCDVLDEEGGVLFVKKPDGRATGDAFVLFKEENEGEIALLKHKEIIGSRYIELFRSTTAEVQQVLNRSTEQSKSVHSVSSAPAPAQPPLISGLPPSLAPVTVIPQQLITAGTRKDCIRLRGLPYEAQVEHILEFLGDHAKNIVYQGVHMVFNAQGQPSGEAFIQMDSEASAFTASNNKHHRYMVFGKKQRYIEVFQCSGEDMSMVLTGGAAGQVNKQAGQPGQQQQPPLLSPGGSMIASPQSPASYPGYSPGIMSRPPPQGSYSPFPAQLVYWPGYPSPPISPTNYYMPGPASSCLLTPSSSIASSGLTSPVPPEQVSPTPTHTSALTVETVTPVKFVRGAAHHHHNGHHGPVNGHGADRQTLLRSSVYIH